MILEPMSFFNEYAEKASELAELSHHNVGNLRTLIVNSPNALDIAAWLYDAENHYVDWRDARILSVVPSWFPQSRALFLERWWPAVYREVGRIDLASMDFDAFGESDLATFDAARWKAVRDRPKPKLASCASPRVNLILSYQSAAEQIESALDAFYGRLQETDDEADCNFIEAWDFFRHDVAVDFDGIQKRWIELPRFDLALDGDQVRFGAVVRLLEDAARAYLFGAHAASIAVCRALTETVLSTFYVDQADLKERTGLSKIICLAEARYAWLRDLDLGRFAEDGHSVMHRLHKPHTIAPSDVANLQYLRLVKTLIDAAMLGRPST